MKAELVKKEGNKVTLKITVDNNKFEEAVNKAYNKTKGKYNIPGFRKGKAPKVVIETQYGKGVFYNDAIDMLFPEVYPEAIKELNIDPIDRPDLDIEEISKDNGLVMVVNVEVKPEFELGAYKGIEISKVDNTVSEEDVEARLNEMVNRNARLTSVEGKTLENGDTAVIDFEGFENGVAFEGGKGENYNLVIGSNTFIPGFEDQLVGKKAGEEVEVNVTFPETYHAENLAGKPVVFNVKVNDVKVKEVPALDDEFAKDTTEFETLAELRADVKTKLEEQAKNAADAEMRNALVEKVSANTEVEVPEAMVQHQIDNMLMELNYQLQYQGLNLQQLLEMTGRGLEELREERRADAERLVKSSLILEAIAEKENVEANDADIDAELEKMAAMYNMEVEKIKSSLRETDIEDIKGQIKIRKTLDLLVENATIA
ncbi:MULTISPECIES: trigger factor [Romboutsia]|jgi:trigger factor|uniref:trigger factor n=1 Tax=Romboutsia TaxID=1501226 RepID=UPI0021738BA5|nr:MULTISPECIES: trigger factor [Romboutsia]MCI9062556.1 trigger factor [Romboutsia sp.]MCI9259308.1 trigger factor [Romboutsia sp.]